MNNNNEYEETQQYTWFQYQVNLWCAWFKQTLLVLGFIFLAGFVWVNTGAIIKLNFPSYSSSDSNYLMTPKVPSTNKKHSTNNED